MKEGYCFYYTTRDGRYFQYENLRRGQALYRYHMARKTMTYRGQALKSCGWSGPH